MSIKQHFTSFLKDVMELKHDSIYTLSSLVRRALNALPRFCQGGGVLAPGFLRQTLARVLFSLCSFNTSYTILSESLAQVNVLFTAASRGPFLKSPVNFSGPKSNIQSVIKRIRARVLFSKLLHFVSLTDSFIM